MTAYQYDNSGNLSRLTRASGDSSNERTTDYAYDGLARVRTETQYPSWPATSPTLVTRYTYDLAGNRQSLVDSLAQTTTFGYDNLNRLTGVTYSDGTTPNVTYGYDPDGNRTGMTDGTGGTSYNYDEAGRLISVTSPGPKTVGYRYDLDGNRTKVIYPDNTAVTYSFDKGSKLSSLADWTNRQVSYAYNPDGSLQQATNFNGTTASYSYDNALRLTQVWNQKGTRDISKHRYTLDTVGNRTQAGLPPVWGWGYNYSGEVGDGTTTDRYSPVPAVSALKGLTSVATGSNFSLALKSDGTVWAWGAGWLLGRGPSQANSSVPLQVTGPNGVGFLTGIIAISAGGNFSLALKSDGTVWAWGNNYYGQLGDGTQTNHYWPVQVSGLTGVGGVAAGGSHSLAVKTDGTVWAWGYGSYGQLGNNSSRDHSTPVQARNFTGAVAVAGGGNHSVARKSDGTVWAWGNNSYGQLGDGTTINRDQPVQVRGPGGVGTLSGVTSATSAGDSTLAAKTDGTAWSWGYNGVGALGDGTTTSRSTPVQVVGPGGSGTTLTDVSVLAGSHALKSDGTVWSWGINSYGQLGIGTHDSNAHPVPVQTIGLSGVGLIAAGYVGQLFAVAPLSEQNHFTTYGYDRLYRLTSASGETNATYGYDPAGNRSTLGSTAYSYDRADRITAAGPTGYTVNSNGNLTARGSDTFGYDQANRLKTASVGGTASLYVYDGDGKRAGKTVGGTQTSFVYDVNASLPVLLDDGTRKYVWGLGLAFAVDASGSPIVYHSDGLGSVRALTDLSGTVVQTYTYDEYGVVLSSSGSITQPFQYTGEQRDAETGLVYLRARMYDPGAGRFLGRDDYPGHLLSPQSLHQYSYVQNRPVTFSDPNGRCGPLCFALIAAGATTEGAAMTETAVAVGATAGFMHYYGDQIRQGVTQAVQAAGDFITQAKKKLNPGTYVGDEPLAPPYDVQKLKTSTGTAWSPPPPQPGYPRGGPDWRARIVSIATILSYIVNSNRNIVGDLVGDSPAPVGPAKPAEAS